MSESYDYTPATWSSGSSFKDARKSYDAHAGRSYAKAASSGKSHEDMLPRSITTDSPAPVVIVCDVTGSMGEWPATIFSKLPYLDHEMRTEYLGEGAEICFAAVGDAYSDKYPVQAQPFSKEAGMQDHLKSLVVEGGGGGGGTETYELAALYFARNVEMPKAVRKPILIMIGDEIPYDMVAPDVAERYAYALVEKRISSEAIFKELMEKYSVYYIRKPYNHRYRGEDKASSQHKVWAKLIGEDRIAFLPEADRVVDVIFGLLARETGRIDYFAKELEGRQRPDQVKTVMKSLATVHAASTPASKRKRLPRGASKLHKPAKGAKKTKPLG